MQWLENGFFDHLDKFANSLGYENFAIAIPLAMVKWQSPEDRDVFIMTLTGEGVRGGGPSTFNPLAVK
jgi:hypothetical protein